jgi:hypothetical protein
MTNGGAPTPTPMSVVAVSQADSKQVANLEPFASSDQFPKMSAGILVTPGYAGLQYFLTASGHIIELQVGPEPGS